MKLTYNNILFILFGMFILTIPFNSLHDTIAFFQGTVGDKTFAKTPLWMKLFKDVLLLCAITLTIAPIVVALNKRLLIIIAFLGLVFAYAFAALLSEVNLAIVLAVRSYLVVFFIFLGFYYYRFDLVRLYPTIRALFYIELIVQILQMLYAPNYYGGTTVLGMNLTNPGTFLIPSTMASYSILTLYYARQQKDRATEIFAVLSVLLSRSTTAYIIIAIFYVIKFARSFRFSYDVIIAVVSVVLVFLFLNIDAITGRPNILANLVTRFMIFSEATDYPFGKGFGLGSGGAVLLHVKDAVIADSTINSLLFNFGYPGAFVYLVLIFISVKYFRLDDILLIAFVCFSITMIIFEMTPFIQFFFFELGKAMRFRRERDEMPRLAHG